MSGILTQNYAGQPQYMVGIRLQFADAIHGSTVRIIRVAPADKVMQGQKFWIAEGRRLPDTVIEGQLSPDAAFKETHDYSEIERFEKNGFVALTVGPMGTEIKWSVFSPCFASLYYILEWLPSAQLPIVLRFYLSGWFEEICTSVDQANTRIEQILSKSELHLTKRTFVEEFDPKGRMLPPMLQRTWHDHTVYPENSIDFIYDERSHNFHVDRVGPQSTIARLFGMSPVSYPYVRGGPYDDIVYEGYTHVLRSGKPRYDHVLAAMRMPDNVVRWLPYQRLIVPGRSGAAVPRISVITEIADVDIRLI